MSQADRAIDASLQELLTTLEEFSETLAITKAIEAAQISPVSTMLTKQAQQLEKQVHSYPKVEYPFELYEIGSQIIELITQMRLGLHRLMLQHTGFLNQCNTIVDIIRGAVYKHPALASQANDYGSLTHPIQASDLDKAVAEAQSRVNLAMAKANAATAAAEEANDLGNDILTQIQDQQEKGKVDQDLMQRSLNHSLTMYAKNAAAVVAADAAAKSLNILEDLLGS